MCDTPISIQEEDGLDRHLHQVLSCIIRSQEHGKKENHNSMEVLLLRSAMWGLLAILGKDNTKVQQALQDRASKCLNTILKEMEDLDLDGEED